MQHETCSEMDEDQESSPMYNTPPGSPPSTDEVPMESYNESVSPVFDHRPFPPPATLNRPIIFMLPDDCVRTNLLALKAAVNKPNEPLIGVNAINLSTLRLSNSVWSTDDLSKRDLFRFVRMRLCSMFTPPCTTADAQLARADLKQLYCFIITAVSRCLLDGIDEINEAWRRNFCADLKAFVLTLVEFEREPMVSLDRSVNSHSLLDGWLFVVQLDRILREPPLKLLTNPEFTIEGGELLIVCINEIFRLTVATWTQNSTPMLPCQCFGLIWSFLRDLCGSSVLSTNVSELLKRCWLTPESAIVEEDSCDSTCIDLRPAADLQMSIEEFCLHLVEHLSPVIESDNATVVLLAATAEWQSLRSMPLPLNSKTEMKLCRVLRLLTHIANNSRTLTGDTVTEMITDALPVFSRLLNVKSAVVSEDISVELCRSTGDLCWDTPNDFFSFVESTVEVVDDSSSCWALFLRLLARICQGDDALRRRMKVTFFKPKSVKELNLPGTRRLVALHLLLAHCQNSTEVDTSLLKFADEMKVGYDTDAAVQRQKVIWKGFGILLHICRRRQDATAAVTVAKRIKNEHDVALKALLTLIRSQNKMPDIFPTGIWTLVADAYTSLLFSIFPQSTVNDGLANIDGKVAKELLEVDWKALLSTLPDSSVKHIGSSRLAMLRFFRSFLQRLANEERAETVIWNCYFKSVWTPLLQLWTTIKPIGGGVDSIVSKLKNPEIHKISLELAHVLRLSIYLQSRTNEAPSIANAVLRVPWRYELNSAWIGLLDGIGCDGHESTSGWTRETQNFFVTVWFRCLVASVGGGVSTVFGQSEAVLESASCLVVKLPVVVQQCPHVAVAERIDSAEGTAIRIFSELGKSESVPKAKEMLVSWFGMLFTKSSSIGICLNAATYRLLGAFFRHCSTLMMEKSGNNHPHLLEFLDRLNIDQIPDIECVNELLNGGMLSGVRRLCAARVNDVNFMKFFTKFLARKLSNLFERILNIFSPSADLTRIDQMFVPATPSDLILTAHLRNGALVEKIADQLTKLESNAALAPPTWRPRLHFYARALQKGSQLTKDFEKVEAALLLPKLDSMYSRLSAAFRDDYKNIIQLLRRDTAISV